MLFWLFVIMIFVGVAASIFGDNTRGWVYDHDLEEVFVGIGCGLAVIGVIISLIMVLVIAVKHVGPDATIAKYEQRYESLVYQYENDIYDNDNDLGKRELMTDIEKWNTDLAYKKEIQRNFWVGIFYMDIYDQFEFIELEKTE